MNGAVVRRGGVRAAQGVVVGGVAACALAGCGGAGHGAPSSSPVRLYDNLRACGSSDHVPPDVSSVVPSASSPPTSVLRTGDAVAFPAASGSRIGLASSSDHAPASIVCLSIRGSGSARRAVILGLRPGFVQVGVEAAGSTEIRRTLVTVTG